jgi:hypothetical protein
MQLLRSVTIHTRALQTKYLGQGKSIEALPVLRMLWATKGTSSQINLVEDWTSSDEFHCQDLAALNRVLDSIGRQDTLRIGGCARIPILLRSVSISETLQSGEVQFGSTSVDRSVSKPFKITDDGVAVLFVPVQDQSRLLAMPTKILQHIVSYATHFLDGVAIDPATTTSTALNIGLLRVSRQLRSEAMRYLFSGNPFILKLPVRDRLTGIPDMRALKR